MTEAVGPPVEATVLYDYTDEDPTYLTIKKGDVLTVYQRKETWWYGVARDGSRGFFPSIYVQVNESRPAVFSPRASRVRPVSMARKCVAKFAFSHPGDENFTMLTLKPGDVITILKQEEEWFEGELLTKERGYFPMNYVQEIEPNENEQQTADTTDVMGRLSQALKLYKLDASPSPRVLAAVELVETERRYVADLQIVQFALVVPLRRNTMEFENANVKGPKKGFSIKLRNEEALHSQLILKHSQLEIIFSNWESILSVNSAFMEAIQARIRLWHQQDAASQTIGAVLLEHIPLFKMYCSYCSNFEKSQSLLAKLRLKSQNFANFLQTIQESGVTGGKTLNSYFITPIQRVPRYIMLIAELLKCTPPTHADYPLLQEALQMVERIAIDINESVRVKENHTLVAKLESTFLSNPRFSAQPRQLQRHGELVKKSSRKDGPERTYIFFLFNDLLAYAAVQPATQKLVLHGKLAIDEHFSIDDTTPDLGGKDRPYRCMIHASKSFQVFFKSMEEQTEWIVDLGRCMSQQIVRREERLKQGAGVKTSSGDECALCLKKFTPMRSKFKCVDCCALMCKGCSKPKEDETQPNGPKAGDLKQESWRGGDISGLGSNPASALSPKSSRVCLSCHDFAQAQKPGKGRNLSLFGGGRKKFSLLKSSLERDHKENVKLESSPSKPSVLLAPPAYRFVNCPELHGLSPKIALEEGYACDVCETPIAVGEKMQVCVPCNFYVCVACQQRPGTEICTLGSARPVLTTMILRTQLGFLERFAASPGSSKEAVDAAIDAEAASNVLGTFDSSDDSEEENDEPSTPSFRGEDPSSPAPLTLSPRRTAIFRSPSLGNDPTGLSLPSPVSEKKIGPRPPPRSPSSSSCAPSSPSTPSSSTSSFSTPPRARPPPPRTDTSRAPPPPKSR